MTVLSIPSKAFLPLHLGMNSPSNNKVTMAITRLTAHFMGGLMSDLVISKYKKVWSYMTLNVPTEARCH